MTSFAVATDEALLIVRPGRTWSVEGTLRGKSVQTVAVVADDSSRMYAGTLGDGFWLSADSGYSWEEAGTGIPHAEITAVAVGHSQGSQPRPVFAGTEPSTMSKSTDGGRSWRELETLTELPSASRWSFPPKPETHHVRWVEVDPNEAGRLYVAIEAGALVRSLDGGETWIDRVPDGPIDTHTAASHRETKGRIYSAAGDGYFESHDGGESWSRSMEGLRHRYLVSVAVDPGDADTVVVSAAMGPSMAYWPGRAEAYLYRKTAGGSFEPVMEGMPDAVGTVASRLATHEAEPGTFYAANNHGLFRSRNGGMSWSALEIDWPAQVFRGGVHALKVFQE